MFTHYRILRPVLEMRENLRQTALAYLRPFPDPFSPPLPIIRGDVTDVK